MPLEHPRRLPCGGRAYRLGRLVLLALPALVTLATALALAAPSAASAAAPTIAAAWSTDVTATSANLHAEVNPEGGSTTYRFEYLTNAAYLGNGESFTGATKAPPGTEAFLGSGSSVQPAFQHLGGLKASTAYEYRIVAVNPESPPGGTPGEPRSLTTEESSPSFALPDSRGWELVSPPDKNGGAIQGPGQNRGGDVLQAAADGNSITYSSASSFGQPTEGAPPASQYLATRAGSGWSTRNITAPTLSGAYGTEAIGVPYRIFSGDLARGLLLNGVHCRGEGEGCPVDAPVLEGSGAPPGYQDYYLRDSASGGFAALLSEANDGFLHLEPKQFSVALAGASPDLRHVVLSTCAKLTEDAVEAPGSEGCDPAKPNLYEWSGGGLALLNANPGAALAAQGAGAVSEDGSRVYFTDEGSLYLREGSTTKRVDEAVGGGGSFQAATPEGQLAFFTTEEGPGEEHLYRYSAAGGPPESIATTVKGVLGASEDGSAVYYQDAGGLKLWQAPATITPIAAGAQAAQPSDFPPATGTARVSADGNELLFLSKESLTGYDNTDQATGEADSEVFLWSAGGLACVSCNPTEERPLGPSSIPGAIANGRPEAFGPGQILTDTYKPRVLSQDGRRLFFDSADSLLPADTDNRADAYEWEAQGEGTCNRPGGCLGLISSGRGAEGASFVDASASGADAFFLTGSSLVPTDPGSADLYDARSGGGFPETPPPLLCESDECSALPVAPEDPTVGTTIPGPGNPPPPSNKRCPKGKRAVVKHGKVRCVAERHHAGRHKRAHRRAARNARGVR